MPLFDYIESKKVSAMDFGFYALIMAAMRKADTDNLRALKTAFPLVWDELSRRYNAPGGLLPGESDTGTPARKRGPRVNVLKLRSESDTRPMGAVPEVPPDRFPCPDCGRTLTTAMRGCPDCMSGGLTP